MPLLFFKVYFKLLVNTDYIFKKFYISGYIMCAFSKIFGVDDSIRGKVRIKIFF